MTDDKANRSARKAAVGHQADDNAAFTAQGGDPRGRIQHFRHTRAANRPFIANNDHVAVLKCLRRAVEHLEKLLLAVENPRGSGEYIVLQTALDTGKLQNGAEFGREVAAENTKTACRLVGCGHRVDHVAVRRRRIKPRNLLGEGLARTGQDITIEKARIEKEEEIKLKDFNVDAEVVAVQPGPVITRFEIQPAAGIKVSKISNLAKDLARSLAVISVRVVEVIPGKTTVGIEIPNADRQTVNFKDVLASSTFEDSKSTLTLALGHDIAGAPVVADLGKMPHVLVAGTTGSGKSVGVNCMLVSLLYKATPADVRLILVDPKMLELSVYDGIPHLLTPVITDMKDAANGLRWCVAEMERRYKLMSLLGVRNLQGYNRKVLDAEKEGAPLLDPMWKPDPVLELTEEEQEHPTLEKLPSIVVVIDEFADMMMIVGKKVEELIARIAQKARAAGIHLVLATQRPSVDVITGLIKANIPSRIAFSVSSRVDSRTILDQGGADQLLGYGDMLYLPAGSSVPVRVHGAFCSDDEVHRVVADWKRRGDPQYLGGLLDEGGQTPVTAHEIQSAASDDEDGEADALYDEAVDYVCRSRRASISSVQRKLRIGYNRAARLIETMEAAGVVSEMGTNGQREVLAPAPPEE